VQLSLCAGACCWPGIKGFSGGFSKAGEVAGRGQVESLLAEELGVREHCFYTTA